jgi:hypothetical protein
MLLDRAAGLRALGAELRSFLLSSRQVGAFAAEITGSPAPYSELLRGMRIEKSQSRLPEMRISDDRWLELKATTAQIEDLCGRLERTSDGSHTHVYASPVSLIVEADESWSGVDG